MDLYKEEVLFYYKNQPNKKKISKFNCVGNSSNSSCGDEVEVRFKVNKDGIIEDVGYTHSGCIISAANMSVMTEKLIGMKLSEAKKISKDDWLKELNLDLTESRKKCALVGYNAIKNGLLKL